MIVNGAPKVLNLQSLIVNLKSLSPVWNCHNIWFKTFVNLVLYSRTAFGNKSFKTDLLLVMFLVSSIGFVWIVSTIMNFTRFGIFHFDNTNIWHFSSRISQTRTPVMSCFLLQFSVFSRIIIHNKIKSKKHNGFSFFVFR
jgi:hypothetical protein